MKAQLLISTCIPPPVVCERSLATLTTKENHIHSGKLLANKNSQEQMIIAVNHIKYINSPKPGSQLLHAG